MRRITEGIAGLLLLLLVQLVLTVALIPTIAGWALADAWHTLIELGTIALFLFGVNVWAMNRGDFSWRVQGLTSIIFWLIFAIMLVPTLYPARQTRRAAIVPPPATTCRSEHWM
jgi:hypothetical protein